MWVVFDILYVKRKGVIAQKIGHFIEKWACNVSRSFLLQDQSLKELYCRQKVMIIRDGFGCSCPRNIDLNADVSFSKNGKFVDIISNYT